MITIIINVGSFKGYSCNILGLLQILFGRKIGLNIHNVLRNNASNYYNTKRRLSWWRYFTTNNCQNPLSFSSLFLNSVVPEKFRYSNTLNLQEKTTDGRILVVVDYSSKWCHHAKWPIRQYVLLYLVTNSVSIYLLYFYDSATVYK